jgi:hypothetical protein
MTNPYIDIPIVDPSVGLSDSSDRLLDTLGVVVANVDELWSVPDTLPKVIPFRVPDKPVRAEVIAEKAAPKQKPKAEKRTQPGTLVPSALRSKRKHWRGEHPCWRCDDGIHAQCRGLRLDGQLCSCSCPGAKDTREEYALHKSLAIERGERVPEPAEVIPLCRRMPKAPKPESSKPKRHIVRRAA